MIKKIFKNYIRVIRCCWGISKFMVFGSFIWTLLDSISKLIPVFVLAELIAYISRGTTITGWFDSYLFLMVFILVAVQVIRDIYWRMFNLYVNNHLYVFDEVLKRQIAQKAIRTKMELFENSDFYNQYAMAISMDGRTIWNAMLNATSSISVLINLVVAATLLISYTWYAAFFFICFIPVFIFSRNKSLSFFRFQMANKEKERKAGVLFGFAFDRKAIQELKLFGGFDYVLNKRYALINEYRDSLLKLNRTNALKGLLIGLLPDILYYIMYILFGLWVLSGTIDIGTFTLLTGNMMVLQSNIGILANSFGFQQKLFARFEQLENFFAAPEDLITLKKKMPFHKLELSNICFRYPNSEQDALHNISLTIKKNEKVAIVGYNGSGKSTLAKVLVGLYKDYDGKYFINDIDTVQMSNRDIHELYSMTMQEFCKYPFSFKENVIIGDTEKEKEKAEKVYIHANQISGAEKIAEKLIQKEQTFLNKEYDEVSTDLSEGQWHTLLLSRTLYRDREIVVFDEPTASLDALAEHNFIKNILLYCNNKTVIAISHRLSNIVEFDKIILLDKGRIIEAGTHKQLMEKDGVYANMFRIQAGRYVSKGETTV